MTIDEKLDSLSEIELKVLGILHILGGGEWGYGNCYYRHDTILAGEGNINSIDQEIGGYSGLSRTLKKLRGLGLAEYRRGLFDGDGVPAGSGNAPAPEYQEDYQRLCEAKGWIE